MASSDPRLVLAVRVVELRRRRGFSQEDLAERMNDLDEERVWTKRDIDALERPTMRSNRVKRPLRFHEIQFLAEALNARGLLMGLGIHGEEVVVRPAAASASASTGFPSVS